MERKFERYREVRGNFIAKLHGHVVHVVEWDGRKQCIVWNVHVYFENIECAMITVAWHIAIIEKSHTTEIIYSNLGITNEVMNVITSFDQKQPLEIVTNG